MDIKKIKEMLLSEESGISADTVISFGKFAAFVPSAFSAMITKMPKFNINKEMANRILSEGLYHCTPSEDVAKDIVSSEHIRPSTRFISYDINEWAFLFPGPPDLDNYLKNLSNDFSDKANPLMHPDMVIDAVKFMPQAKDLVNYKCRSVNDEVIMYQGTCVLPHQAVSAVKLVPDLVRDKNGAPIKDAYGEYSISFREASLEELIQGTNKYMPKQDYLDFVNEKAKERNYVQPRSADNRSKLEKLMIEAVNKGINAWDSLNTILDIGYIESESTIDSVKRNYRDIFKDIQNSLKERFSKKMIAPSVDTALDGYKLERKNPFRDRKFSQKIAEFQTEGIVQFDLKDLLSEFTHSKAGAFFSQKYRDIGENISRKGIHGKSHTDRTSLTAMMIAEKEGVFQGEDAMRYMDILSTATMYHDIGRILDQGPHAGRGARKVKRMDLKYIDGKDYSELDKKMVMALIEGHEGKLDKISKLMKKYKIDDPQEQAMLLKLNSIVRDADALDRVRIDSNGLTAYKVNLKPEFLVNDSAKTMVMSAYQLEDVRNAMGNMQSIIDYKLDKSKVKEIDESRGIKGLSSKSFDDRIHYEVRQDINIEDIGKNEVARGREDSQKTNDGDERY